MPPTHHYTSLRRSSSITADDACILCSKVSSVSAANKGKSLGRKTRKLNTRVNRARKAIEEQDEEIELHHHMPPHPLPQVEPADLHTEAIEADELERLLESALRLSTSSVSGAALPVVEQEQEQQQQQQQEEEDELLSDDAIRVDLATLIHTCATAVGNDMPLTPRTICAVTATMDELSAEEEQARRAQEYDYNDALLADLDASGLWKPYYPHD